MIDSAKCTIRATPVSAVQINNPETGALVVKVNFDGTVEFGPDVTPDEAARQMWEALAGYAEHWLIAKEASHD